MWGPLTELVLPSNPYSNSLNQTCDGLTPSPKIRSATKQWMGWLRSQNEGWSQPNPLVPQPNTR